LHKLIDFRFYSSTEIMPSEGMREGSEMDHVLNSIEPFYDVTLDQFMEEQRAIFVKDMEKVVGVLLFSKKHN